MALARSASGPGALSINTGTANSLFGSTTPQQPAAGGGLFGATASQPPQSAQSASLFGTAAPSQPQTTGSLFGTTTAQPGQQQKPGGLFGTQPATTTPQQTTGGLFGQPATARQQQPQPTGGLFGQTATAQQPQQPGGLFASTTTQQQPQPTMSLFGGGAAAAQPGGLFGTSTSAQQPQQPQPGGLFGAKPAGTTTLFGSTLPAGQTQTQPSLFGSQLGQQQQQQAAGLTMGQSANRPQVVPGVRIDVSNIRPTTRFNDLQEDIQKDIARIDEGIQKCIRDKEAVDAFLPAHGEQLAAIPADVSFVTRKSVGAQGALSGDVAAINQLRDLIKKDADNARLSFKAIDNLRLPTQYHQAGLWSNLRQPGSVGGGSAAADAETNADLISYFSKTADEMDEMMKKFERNLGEIEVHLHGVQGNMLEQLQRAAAQSKTGGQGGVDERVVELAAVLRDFEESILKVAGVVGGVKENITELQLKDFMGHGS